MGLLTENQLGGFLAGFSATAFRFEIRERYNSEVGKEPFRKWCAGELDDYAWHRSWMEKIRQDRTMGKSWERVRIVAVPPSTYTRYGLDIARLSIEAGEDIRYLRRDIADELGLAPYDAWLLDSRQLIHLHFSDDDDTFTGAELVEAPEIVVRHQEWQDLAWKHAQTREEFIAALP